MALPRQVEKEMAEIEQMEAEMTKQKVQSAEPVEDKAEVVEEATEVKAEAVESIEEVKKPEKVKQKSQHEDPVLAKADELVSDDELTWEQRFKTLQGMHRSVAPQLHAQVKELTSKLDSQSREVEAMRKELAQAKDATRKAEEKAKYVTAEDVDSFGEELIDVQRRVAKEVFQEHVVPLQDQLKQLQAENEELRNQVSATGNEVGQSRFESELRRAIPDFDTVNTDPEWIAWLDDYDPMIRGQRRTVAQEAFNRGDVGAIADYMAMFKSSKQPSPVNKRKDLERQVSPTKANATANVATAGSGRVYSEAEVSKLFDKVRNLSIAHKYDEANKLEAELTAAYVEGRVRA